MRITLLKLQIIKMSCFRRSLCSIIHKRKDPFVGVFKTELGITRTLQCVLVTMNFVLVNNYFTNNSELTSSIFDMLMIFNTFILAYIITSILTVMLCMVDIYLYETLHVVISKVLASLSIFQVISVVYTIEKNSSLARATLISTSIMLTIVVIYDWSFGKRILTNERPRDVYSWYYFNGVDTASCFSGCSYLLETRWKHLEEQEQSTPAAEFQRNAHHSKLSVVSETKDESVNVGGARSKVKSNDEAINVGGARNKTKPNDESVNVGGARSKVKSNEAINVGGVRSKTKQKVLKGSQLTHSYVNVSFLADERSSVPEEKESATESYGARFDEHKAIRPTLNKEYGAVRRVQFYEPQTSIAAAQAKERNDGSDICPTSKPITEKIMDKTTKETSRNPKIILQDPENGMKEILP